MQSSNHIAGKHPQFQGIGNTESWVLFPMSQPSAKTGGVSNTGKSSGNQSDNEQQEEAYLIPGEEPWSHAKVMSCPDAPFWEDAEAYEFLQITKLGTYKLVPLPPGHTAIGSCWVYKVKHDNDNNITQYHACLVVQGCTQHPSIDFFETYTPVA